MGCIKSFFISGGSVSKHEENITNNIKQGQFTKFELLDGSYVMINDKNVLMIEVFSESDVK